MVLTLQQLVQQSVESKQVTVNGFPALAIVADQVAEQQQQQQQQAPAVRTLIPLQREQEKASAAAGAEAIPDFLSSHPGDRYHGEAARGPGAAANERHQPRGGPRLVPASD